MLQGCQTLQDGSRLKFRSACFLADLLAHPGLTRANGAAALPEAELLLLSSSLGGLPQADEDAAIPLLLQAALDKTMKVKDALPAEEDGGRGQGAAVLQGHNDLPVTEGDSAFDRAAIYQSLSTDPFVRDDAYNGYSLSDAGYNLKDAVSAYGPSSTLKNFNIRGAMSATWVQLEALVQQYLAKRDFDDTDGTSYYYDLSYNEFGSGQPDAVDLEGTSSGESVDYYGVLDVSDVTYDGVDSSSLEELEAYTNYDYPYYFGGIDSRPEKGQLINRRLLRDKKLSVRM